MRFTSITLDFKIKERLDKLKRPNNPPRKPGTRERESYGNVVKRVLAALDRQE